MAILFEVKDPFGVVILCTVAWWVEHVLSQRSEMSDYLFWVKKAISSPDAIYDSTKKKNHHVHYILPTGKKLYVRVIVRIHDSKKGEFITAHLIDKPKQGERLIWSR